MEILFIVAIVGSVVITRMRWRFWPSAVAAVLVTFVIWTGIALYLPHSPLAEPMLFFVVTFGASVVSFLAVWGIDIFFFRKRRNSTNGSDR